MHIRQPLCVLCWLLSLPLALLLGALAQGAEAESIPESLKIVSLEIRPASVQLKGRFDYRQLLVLGKTSEGESVDLTRLATPASSGDAFSLSADGQVRATKNGNGEITYTFANLTAKAPVTVTDFDSPREVSFVRDVQPILSRTGCNQGTCHGSKDGKNGFKLSLRGYDPLYDHRALTDDIAARRINRPAPDQSLLLLKATGSVPHVGGVRMNVDDPYYELLREWIAQGVKLDLDAPRVTKIEVFPLDPVVPRAGMKQQMTVIATYADGTTRDVTREAFIESGNIEVVEASQTGVVTTLRRGEAPVLVRYEGAYAATTVVCMGDRSGFVWQQPPAYNYIDEHVYAKLQSVKVLPSELCTDDEFVRRVYLDLTGLPPTAPQVRSFLADMRDSKTKREALVDQLVGNREYVEHWTNKWADMLQVNRKFLGEEGSIALRNWIKDSIATNKPYDRFAAEILTASGSNLENPPAAYYKVMRTPDALMENTTHLFLAVRFNCNKCHDHPFERWTQDQYYHLAAFFAQVGRKEDPLFAGQKIGGSAVEGATPLVEVIYDAGSGEIKHDRTGEVSPPAFPYQQPDSPASALSRRDQLARWMTSADNQYFAKSYVNRLFGYLFGVGIIEPIDDIRAGNPPSNPELLDALTRDFIEHGFDTQHIMRTICKSRTYQLSVTTNRWNEDDTLNYSHAIPRRLPAEALFDAIHTAAGATPKLPGVPAGFRAAQLPDAGVSVPFLDDFGKPVRESSCECERSSGMVLGPVLKLINGPTVADALADPQSELAKLVATEQDDAKVIEEVFLRFLARPPTAAEIEVGRQALKMAAGDSTKAAAALAEYEKQLPARQEAWEAIAGKPVVWTELDFSSMQSSVGATFQKLDDKSLLASGADGKDVYTLSGETDVKGITGVRLEALTDPSLPAQGPGRAMNGNFVLNELTLTAASKADPAQTAEIKFQNASAEFSQANWAVAGAVDGNPGTGWAVSPQFGKPHTATFETTADAGFDGGTLLTFKLSQQYQDGKHLLGRFRISITTSPRLIVGSKLPDEIAAILAAPKADRTPAQADALASYYRSIDGELARLQADLKRAEDEVKNARLIGVQDLAWALINNPAFLFNR